MTGRMAETLLRWTLNGEKQPALLCSAGDEAALLTGLLITGRRADRIDGIRQEPDGWQVRAQTRPARDLAARLEELPPLASPLTAEKAELNALHREAMAWRRESGQHIALLASGGRRAAGLDIGRHNALDKAVGLALAQGMSLDRAALFTSGRLSAELLAKAAAAGIPILCSAKQAGSLCIAYAEKLNMALYQPGPEGETFGAAWRIKECKL